MMKCLKRGENQLSLEVRSTAVQLAVLAAPPPSGHYPNDGFTFYNKTKQTKKRGYAVFYVDDDGHTSRRCSLVKTTDDPCSQSETSQQITAPSPRSPSPASSRQLS